MSELDPRLMSEVATLMSREIECDATVMPPATAPASAASGDLPGSDAEPEVIAVLGEGGMGLVELVRQPGLEREVAVKRLKPGAASAAAEQLLVQEARLTGSLEHPNIVPIHSLQRDRDGHPCLMMKRLEGVAWRELLRDPHHPRWGSDSGDRLTRHLEILVRVTHALHFAHSRGILHRDVKPANVMVGDFGEVYLVDWGLAARVTDLATQGWTGICGTPAYLAPEQLACGEPLTPQTDVYQLGATLHEILTGSPRHTGADLESVLRAAAVSHPIEYGPEVPAELAALCNRATSRDPAARPRSALEFRQVLEDYQRHRASADLAHEAKRRLERLREPSPDRDENTSRQLITECRFGFMQALRTWEGNAPAQEGLRETLELAVAFEIAHRNEGAAAALLAELAAPPASLVRALEDLRQRRAEQERALEELASARYHRGLGARWHLRAYAAATLNGLLGFASLAAALSGVPPRPIHGVLATGLMFVAFTAMNTVLRSRMIHTETNRKHLLSIWIAVTLVFSQQLHGWHHDVPFEPSLRVTLLLLITMSAILAVTLVTRMLAVTVSAAAALVLSLLGPGQPFYPLALLLIVNSISFSTWLSVEPEPGPPPPPPP